ncbi:hypothetical protein C0J52_17782 [Blattella germanica]|nr:hypothetical protein C0J52_17782 [Blattella germanica]
MQTTYFLFDTEPGDVITGVLSSLKLTSMMLLESGVLGALHSPVPEPSNMSTMSKRFEEYVANSFPERRVKVEAVKSLKVY